MMRSSWKILVSYPWGDKLSKQWDESHTCVTKFSRDWKSRLFPSPSFHQGMSCSETEFSLFSNFLLWSSPLTMTFYYPPGSDLHFSPYRLTFLNFLYSTSFNACFLFILVTEQGFIGAQVRPITVSDSVWPSLPRTSVILTVCALIFKLSWAQQHSPHVLFHHHRLHFMSLFSIWFLSCGNLLDWTVQFSGKTGWSRSSQGLLGFFLRMFFFSKKKTFLYPTKISLQPVNFRVDIIYILFEMWWWMPKYSLYFFPLLFQGDKSVKPPTTTLSNTFSLSFLSAVDTLSPLRGSGYESRDDNTQVPFEHRTRKSYFFSSVSTNQDWKESGVCCDWESFYFLCHPPITHRGGVGIRWRKEEKGDFQQPMKREKVQR